MKKYHSRHIPIWDGWFVNDNGRLHMFHLQDPRPDCPFPLRNPGLWATLSVMTGCTGSSRKASCLPLVMTAFRWIIISNLPAAPSKRMTCAISFTPCKDKELASQRIGVSTSTDMVNWDIYPGNPVIVPDDRILLGYEKLPHIEWQIVDCRDPHCGMG